MSTLAAILSLQCTRWRCLMMKLLVLALLLDAASARNNCTVTGVSFGFTINRDTNSVVCDGTDACQGASISGCDTVTCGERDCTGVNIADSSTVICKGESGCRQAVIGTALNPVDSVTCQGPSWTCYQAQIFANKTIVCNDNSGSGDVNTNGVCGFAILETQCLQCIGTNHGCGGGTGCELFGEPCPEFRYGGTTCDAVCPEGETCPVNQTLPDGEQVSSSGPRDSWKQQLGAATMMVAWLLS